MLLGVPKEIKDQELRVGMLPSCVKEIVGEGHQVLVQKGAGVGAEAGDDEYHQAGAVIVDSAREIYAKAEMVVKVKEPLAEERKLLREDQILFSYLHLAPDKEQTDDLIKSKAICIAYETVLGADKRSTPLLTPMSQIAGRLSIQVGARLLESVVGGRGVLIGSVPGVRPSFVTIIGGGHVGSHAAEVAVGMGAHVMVLDKNLEVLNYLSERFGNTVETCYATRHNIEIAVARADLVVGAIHVRGQRAARLVTREMIKKMHPKSAVVDVAIDQGGCFETSHPTTHSKPTYLEEEVIHYCVTNMPGVVPVSSTHALNHATLKYILELASLGAREGMRRDSGLAAGLNVWRGAVTNRAVAETQSKEYVSPSSVLDN